jgi:E3 ubiquitin-protein ligase HUWE1
MMQVTEDTGPGRIFVRANEETGNRRPVMISLTETPKPVLDTKENKSDDKSSDEEMKDITDQVQKTSTENSDQAEQQTKTNQLLPKLKKLSDIECSTLLHACVSLMGLSVDADALNAILRLLLRLTQDFEQAVVFAQLGGVKMLLDLTQASSFSGFSSLATLLIRHVMEDPVTLRQTMEKVIRSSTVNSSSSNTKEYYTKCLVL